MPTGHPKIGSSLEVLGTVKTEITDPNPISPTSVFNEIDLVEPPPPWELEDATLALSDARRFIEVPENWEVRWINPRILDAEGWRHWQPVLASDERVKVKVRTMVTPDGNIRRGGLNGDILAWMYKSWVDSRRQLRIEANVRLAARAVENQEALKEDFKRGKYGPYLEIEEARHPSHTIAEGRTMKD